MSMVVISISSQQDDIHTWGGYGGGETLSLEEGFKITSISEEELKGYKRSILPSLKTQYKL